jgi:hypothetical protein
MTTFKGKKYQHLKQKQIMRTKITNPVSALFVLAAFILNFTACKKETMVTPASELQAITSVQSNAAVTSNERIDYNFLFFIPCANGGVGEDVEFSGSLHNLTTFTISGNHVSGTFHSQPQGMSGVGVITGDKYQATGLSQYQFKGSFVNGQYEETYVANVNLIGRGSGNNYLFHETFHITINANGEVTTWFDKFTVDCK